MYEHAQVIIIFFLDACIGVNAVIEDISPMHAGGLHYDRW